MVSSHLNWLIIRDHNSFLLKQKNIRKPFSKEPGNLTNLSSYRYSGLVHRKTITITPAEKKGVHFMAKKVKFTNKPAKSVEKVTFRSEASHHTMRKVQNYIKQRRYRRDLKQAALRRICAILRSQRTVNPKKSKAGTAPAAPAAATTAAAPKKAA